MSWCKQSVHKCAIKVSLSKMSEEDGLGRVVGSSREEGKITIGVGAADDFGTGRPVDGQALGTDGDATIVADLNRSALTPDIGPPGTARIGTQEGALFLQGPLPGGVGGGGNLAMFFVGVTMEAQLVEQGIGGIEGGDVFGGKKGGQTPLPVAMGALDFAFGLRRGRVAQGDAVKMQGGPELGKSLGRAGEEKGMIIDVESHGQAVRGEGPGEQIKVTQEIFVRVKPGGGNDAAVIVDEFGREGWPARPANQA